MILQVTREERSTVQGVAWVREEPNVLDSHGSKQYNKIHTVAFVSATSFLFDSFIVIILNVMRVIGSEYLIEKIISAKVGE